MPLASLVLLASYVTPQLPHQRRAPAPRMAEGKQVNSILEELDRELAAYSELRAEQQKTTQEKIARQQAEASKSVGKVVAFGARLDDDVAGNEIDKKLRIELHEQLFDKGVALMSRGEYKSAVTAFTQATAAAPGGMIDRKGGQYAIYLAQALQADNRKQEALGLLQRCGAHPDGDVRKISSQVLYIMNAPELKLDASHFVSITPLEDAQDWSTRKRGVMPKDPPPEKYSLEWYVLEGERNKRAREVAGQRVQNTQQQALVAGAALAVMTLGLIAVRSL